MKGGSFLSAGLKRFAGYTNISAKARVEKNLGGVFVAT